MITTPKSSAPLPPRPDRWRRRGHGRLVLAVVAPVLAVMALGSYVVQGKLESYRHCTDVLVAEQLARAAHVLARELHEERAQSARFVLAGRGGEQAELDYRRELTNRRLEDFRRLAAQPQIQPLIGADRRGFDLGEIDAQRANVDAGDSVASVLGGYDRVIDDLLSTTTRMPIDEVVGLAAYADLGGFSDRMARVAGSGNAVIEGRGGRELSARMSEAHAETKAFAELFRLHATGPRQAFAQTLAADPAMAEIETLYRKAITGKLGPADAETWRAAHRLFARHVAETDDQVAAAIEHDIAQRLSSARTGFAVALLVVLAVIGLVLETLRRSERRAAVAEETSRMMFRAVEQSPVAVMITDPTGIIEYVNDAFTSMTGFERTEVIGKNPRIQRSFDTPDHVFTDMWRTIQAGDEWRGELKNRRKNDGVYWESMIVAPVRGVTGQIVNYIALKEDVTERRAAEEAQAAARQAAELANRAKSEFLAAMSHELRTPLNAIIGFSDIMSAQPHGEIDPQYREYVADINQSGRHLLQLINDILDVARLDVGRLALREEELEVAALARSAANMVRERAESGSIELVTEIAPDLPSVWADSRRLKQVLVNVLANAVKFTPQGGRVEMSAGPSAEGGLVFVIKDSGIGIAPDQLARVMSPFVQVDSGMARQYEGSGLGLPLARQLIELHGGTIHLVSALGSGTTVTLTLPPERMRTPSA